MIKLLYLQCPQSIPKLMYFFLSPLFDDTDFKYSLNKLYSNFLLLEKSVLKSKIEIILLFECELLRCHTFK